MTLAVLSLLLATTSGPSATGALQDWLADVREQAAIPGVVAIIVKTSEPEPSFISLGTDTTGAAITPKSVFGIGSLSKSFTAMGVMLLVERGLVSLDDPISKWIPEMDSRITVRHLLNQTSGLPGSSGFWLEAGSLTERVAALKGVELRTAPGAEYSYSNANYDVLGLLIEKVSHVSYRQFTREQVLAPAGLDGVWVGNELTPPPIGFQDWFGVFRTTRVADEWTPGITPAGGYFATAEGMAKALRLHLLNGSELSAPLLSEAAFHTLHESGTLPAGAPYAMGWTQRQLDGEPMFIHAGQTGEFTSTMALFPKSGLAVAVLANVNAFQSPATRLGTRDLMTGLAQKIQNRPAETSSVFGYRNQPATKWLFVVLALAGLARWIRYFQLRPKKPSWYALFQLTWAAMFLTMVPVVAEVPLLAMFRFNPDLAVLLIIGATGSVARAVCIVWFSRSDGHPAKSHVRPLV